jgi:hypothetical protein
MEPQVDQTDLRSPEERSLGELVSDLGRETSSLVRHEIALARVEMVEKLADAGKDAAFVAGGGALAYAGALAIVAGVVALLATWIPLFLSAFIVGAVACIGGYFLLRHCKEQMRKIDFVPERTVRNVKQDARAFQGH